MKEEGEEEGEENYVAEEGALVESVSDIGEHLQVENKRKLKSYDKKNEKNKQLNRLKLNI